MKISAVVPFVAIMIIVLCMSMNEEQEHGQRVNEMAGPLLPNLSSYKMFAGKLSDLVPANGFVPYELSTGLFSDYAEKQRLICLPEGTVFKPTGAGLPTFPDGTKLVKTFYYPFDQRDPSKGKKLVETRVMIKRDGYWTAGTYLWNSDATDALLVQKGASIPITWLDKHGIEHSLKFQVPSQSECSTCHRVGKTIEPIGFKLRNLNIVIRKNNVEINQLLYFRNLHMMDQDTDNFNPMKTSERLVESRAREYLDINCGHCHQVDGYCATSDLRLTYEDSQNAHLIAKMSDKIIKMMVNGRMPMKGTTVIDEQGVTLIKEYLNTLKTSK